MKIKDCLPQIIELLKSIDGKLHHHSNTPTTPPEPIIKEVEVIKEIEVIKEVPKEIIKEIEVIKEVPDAFSRTLASERKLLTQVQQDPILSEILLHRHQNSSENQQFIALIANAAQWNTIEILFDKLAQRCKDEQRPAHASELDILQQCLAIHNLIWQNQTAQLRSISIGTPYDYKKHNSSNGRGDTIAAEWLPELLNTSGKTSKPALVQTQ